MVIWFLQKNFTFAVRDSLLNIGPLKDFSYGLRINGDPNATGVAKQSNYELVSCRFILQFKLAYQLITSALQKKCCPYLLNCPSLFRHLQSFVIWYTKHVWIPYLGMLFWPWKKWCSHSTSKINPPRYNNSSVYTSFYSLHWLLYIWLLPCFLLILTLFWKMLYPTCDFFPMSSSNEWIICE